MNKKQKLAAFTGMSALLVGSAALAVPKKPLNIIYIMSDDHTEQMISAYDLRFGHTPAIDRIAGEGLRFTRSFVANSISGPSRACMLTGKHSHKNGKVDNQDHFDGSQQTMPKLMQAAGYQTAMIGKWHLESLPTGFDYWEILPGQGNYYEPDFITSKGMHRERGYVTDLITDKSIDWLEQRDKQKPFLMFVHHKTAHRNWMAKLDDLYAYEDKTFPVPANFFDSYANRPAAAGQEMEIDRHMTFLYDLKVQHPRGEKHPYDGFVNGPDGTFGRMRPDDRRVWDQFYDSISNDLKERNLSGRDLVLWKYQRYIKDYLKTAKSMDDNIARLLDYLEKEGLLDNTLIVYTSDQGFYMGEHGWFDKRFMYEESLRTPLVIRIPDAMAGRRGRVVSQLVQNIDHAATFLDLAGVPVPGDIQGESYADLIRGKKSAGNRKAIYYHYQEYPAEHMVKRHYGIRTERYKLIHFYNDIDHWELYDLKKDPSEMTNLAANPRYRKLLAKLKVQLHELQVKYDDPIRFRFPPVAGLHTK
ncbi:MAG: sulfatase [Paludibacter sp. 47-17]|nr:MAG: sulfatase [Paludibacter sp. 47-17]